MYILRTIFFIVLSLGALIVVMHYGMGRSVNEIAGVLAMGGLFVGLSIWGYLKMYSGDE